MNTPYKWAGIILALCIAVSAVPFLTETSEAASGTSEEDPLTWYNKTIILLPEVLEGTITDSESQALQPPASLLIDWGDGSSEVKEVDGYVIKGSLEIEHTYEKTGIYHITCTPQNAGYIYESYELWMEIMGAPSVYFYDGDEEICDSVVAYNGKGIGAYEDNYFSRITAPAVPVKDGYIFDYWTLNGEKFDFDTVITAPTLLKAHWTPVQYITVTVDGVSGQFAEGSRVSDITVPVKDGFAFDGWFSDSACTVSVAKDTVLTDGMSLWSGWTQIVVPVEKITVNVDGKELTFDAGTKVSDLTLPEKEGYTFDGWFSDSACTVSVDNGTELTDGMSLWSGWTQIVVPVEKITVNVDGKELTFDAGTKVSDLTVTEKKGSEFKGWYSDKDLTVSVTDTTVLTDGMVLFSKYDEKKVSGTSAVNIAICIVGAIIAFIGLRYHPAILVVGAAVVVLGVADIYGIIDVIR